MDADPLFVDPANGDYHLSSESPCIDAGDPEVTYPGDRKDFNGLDIAVIANGANWGMHVNSDAPPTNYRADVNRDGVVNGLDRAQITNTECWGQAECGSP